MYGKLPACSTDMIQVALRATCIKNVKYKIIKIRTGCPNVGYLNSRKNVNCAACVSRAAGWA